MYFNSEFVDQGKAKTLEIPSLGIKKKGAQKFTNTTLGGFLVIFKVESTPPPKKKKKKNVF